MIATVSWQYIILNGDNATGYRVKKRTGGALPPVYNMGTDFVGSDSWNKTAEHVLQYGDRNYVFAFWSVTGHDMLSPQTEAHIGLNRYVDSSHPLLPQYGGAWDITAKAYYVWEFGIGGGDNALLIDAFDVQAGDFIADDFVDATPNEFTKDANEGYIDTTLQIIEGNAIQVRARNILPTNKSFGYWHEIASVGYSNNPATPVEVGTPTSQDIVVHYNDIVVAFAFYNELPLKLKKPSHDEIYDWAWWIKTHGGLIREYFNPLTAELQAAILLTYMADTVSAKLRESVFQIVLKQIAIAAESIKNNMKETRK